jgi:drug/metabolite transporter (DMT)-like permease
MSEKMSLLAGTNSPKWPDEIFQTKNIFIVTFLILQTAILVLQKLVSQPMYNYSYILTLSQSCCTMFGFAILVLIHSIYDFIQRKQASKTNYHNINEPQQSYDKIVEFRSQNGQQYFSPSDYIDTTTLDSFADLSDQRKSVPKLQFAILGVLFLLANFFNYNGMRGNSLPGSIVIILQQTVVPFTMFFSLLFLRRRYRVWHYVGATLILTGVIFSLWDRLYNLKFDAPFWSILFVLGATLLLSVAITYMDYTLHHRVIFLSSIIVGVVF